MFLFFKHNVNFVLKNVNMADLNVELVKQLSNNIDKLMRKKDFSKIKLILKEQAPMYLNKIKEKENE